MTGRLDLINRNLPNGLEPPDSEGDILRHESSLDCPLQTLRFLFWYEIQNGGYGRT